MEFYKGQSSEDKIVGGGSYVTDNDMGHEVCNFADQDGQVYGYVQPPGPGGGEPNSGKINIDKLKAENEESVNDVTVVWTARRPKVGTVVVGWYKNAKVYRHFQRYTDKPKLHNDNGLAGYWIKAELDNVTLLPLDMRVLKIPRRSKGFMGQANIWYADSEESKPLVDSVLTMIRGGNTTRHVRSRRTDVEHNAKVEKAAIDTTREYYERYSYTIESVEKDNVGWDLEAYMGDEKLNIEVKGLSGPVAKIELTPNEYHAFRTCNLNYRLAIVTMALTEPQLKICRFSSGRNDWIVENHHESNIDIREKGSAVIRVDV